MKTNSSLSYELEQPLSKKFGNENDNTAHNKHHILERSIHIPEAVLYPLIYDNEKAQILATPAFQNMKSHPFSSQDIYAGQEASDFKGNG